MQGRTIWNRDEAQAFLHPRSMCIFDLNDCELHLINID